MLFVRMSFIGAGLGTGVIVFCVMSVNQPPVDEPCVEELSFDNDVLPFRRRRVLVGITG